MEIYEKLRNELRNLIFPSSFLMRNVLEAVRTVHTRFDEALLAIETGTIRSYEENHQSTLHISRCLRGKGRLISVDKDPQSIKISRDVCRRETNIIWVEAESLAYLNSLQGPQFHFAFLDSVNDEDYIFDEFRSLIPLMKEGSVLLVDDAGLSRKTSQPDSASTARKGRRVWRFLKGCGARFDILATAWFHGTQLRVDLDRNNLHQIKTHL